MSYSEREIRENLGKSLPTDSLKNFDKEFNKAIASFLLGEYSKAKDIIAKLSENDENPRWLLNYGYLLYQEGLYEDALSSFRKLIDLSPYYVEAYLNSAKIYLELKNYNEARKYCDAATKIAPNRADVKKANALLLLEKGEINNFLKQTKDIPDNAIFENPSDNDIDRIKQNSSTVIGNRTISTMIVIFSDVGLRTVLVGYKDDKNNFPKPEMEYKWNPLSKLAENISIEVIDNDDSVGLIGVRANGLENNEKKETAMGFLKVDFKFKDLSNIKEENYVGLLLVDYDKKLRLEPRQIFLKELTSVPEGDLIDIYQDMIFPKEQFTSSSDNKIPKVFLSYAREDIEKAEYIFSNLRKKGLDVWKDDKSLKIGERFESKIEAAIEHADFAIVCLSSKSIKKIGFVQKEFKLIIEAAKYRPFNIPFTLPVKLDDCEIPREFREYHWKDFSDNKREFLDELAQEIIGHYEIVNKKV